LQQTAGRKVSILLMSIVVDGTGGHSTRTGGSSMDGTESWVGEAKGGLLSAEAGPEGFCGVDVGVGLLELSEKDI
jgi:hypothetical protein